MLFLIIFGWNPDRVCIDEGDSQRLVLDLGGVPMFLSFLDRFLIPIDSSESGSSGFNGMKRSALNSLEALVEITPLQSQKLFVGLYSLAHLVNNKRSAWLLANCDGIDKLVHFCCSSVAYEGKNDALNVVIQVFFFLPVLPFECIANGDYPLFLFCIIDIGPCDCIQRAKNMVAAVTEWNGVCIRLCIPGRLERH